MLIGGMPQVISTYLETNNFRNVDNMKRTIINLYEDDLRKIDSTGRLGLIFNAIPSELGKNSKGFQIKKVLNSYDITDDSIYSLMSELKDSKIINVAYNSNDLGVSLNTYKDLNKFKIYLVDTGLFTTLQFKNKDFTENIVYEKLLSDKIETNLGYLYENAVAQILVSSSYELFYYIYFDEKQKRNYKVYFIFSKGNKICPIEVKSSNYRTHKSLDEFYKNYSSRILHRYIIHIKDFNKEEDILCLPIYLTSFIL